MNLPQPPTQLEMFPRPKMTVAQYVYKCWLWHMRGGNRYHYSPDAKQVLKAVCDELGLPEALVSRIVRVQSRWEARRFLRGLNGNA